MHPAGGDAAQGQPCYSPGLSFTLVKRPGTSGNPSPEGALFDRLQRPFPIRVGEIGRALARESVAGLVRNILQRTGHSV